MERKLTATHVWAESYDRELKDISAVQDEVRQRYEEAIASLKQFISRSPNILHAHLTLAAVYSELGQEAEARAEVAELLRINPNLSLEWLRQMVPFKDPAVLERFLAALRKAGLK
jgi:adenylate cyclase